MSFSNNRLTWDNHYTRPKSQQTIPDENVVRYIHQYRQKPEAEGLVVDLGCGSGRNLNYIRLYYPDAIGIDFALHALAGKTGVLCADTAAIPLPDGSVSLLIAWGVLHYLDQDKLELTLSEIRRVLKPGGAFFGSIRSSNDTHLAGVLEKGDLSSGAARTFTLEESKELLKEFTTLRFGYISRIPLGESRLIAHHFFEAER